MTAPVPVSRRTLLAVLAAAGLVGGTPALAGCAAGRLDLASASVDRRPSDGSVSVSVVDSLSTFSGVVLDRLADDDNLICSPLSIWVALAMTRNGARGATATEMDTALRFPPLAELNRGLNALTQLLGTRSGTKKVADTKGEIWLDLANQVFGERSITWLEPFLTVLAEFYGTGMARADFVGDPQGERRVINQWVADVTHDKIVDLIPADLITPMTRMVLVNAVYLKAPWATPFADPVPGEFSTPSGRQPADMMTAVFSGRASTGQGWQAVEIVYLGGQLAMTVILPDPGAGDAVRAGLPDGLITDVLSSLEPGRSITLTMPTYSFRTRAALRELLESLGMRRAFVGADFSGMTGQAELVVADVVHQGWIAVDQHGTEAAAATAVVMREVSAPAPDRVLTLVLDRPFWFVIHDVPTAAPLLVGRVTDPTAG